MATDNGKPLIQRHGLGLNVRYDKEAYLKTLRGFMITEANKVLRTPLIIDSLGETIESLSQKVAEPSSFPVQYVALVSSLAKRKLGFFDEYRKFEEHIQNGEASEEEYQVITQKMGPAHKDIDTYWIVNETDPRVRLETINVIANRLPPLPQSIRNLTHYDIQESSIRTPEQVLESFNLISSSPDKVSNKHESQFVDRSPTKDVLPVIAWESISPNPLLKEEIEKSKRNSSLRGIADYLSETIVPYVREARKEIPEDYESIVKQIVVELNAGEYGLTTQNREAQKMFLTQSVI